MPPPVETIAVPTPGAPSTPPLSPVSSMGSAAGSAQGLLVLAVVAIAAFPIIIYAVDSHPSPSVMRRFDCPSFAFDSWGGAEGGGAAPWAGIAAARIRMGFKYIASDIQLDASPSGVGSFSMHAVLRPPPKEHIEGGLALGYKRAYLGNSMREGFEVGLPHQYTLWRERGRLLQIELRPGVFLTTQKTVDVSVDLAVLLPVLEVLSVRLGSRLYTFDGQPMIGLSAGLSLHL